MAGFGRREIEYMQSLCIYNRYIECYSVVNRQSLSFDKKRDLEILKYKITQICLRQWTPQSSFNLISYPKSQILLFYFMHSEHNSFYRSQKLSSFSNTNVFFTNNNKEHKIKFIWYKKDRFSNCVYWYLYNATILVLQDRLEAPQEVQDLVKTLSRHVR